MRPSARARRAVKWERMRLGRAAAEACRRDAVSCERMRLGCEPVDLDVQDSGEMRLVRAEHILRGAVSQACKLRLCGSGISYNAAISAFAKCRYAADAPGTRGGVAHLARYGQPGVQYVVIWWGISYNAAISACEKSR